MVGVCTISRKHLSESGFIITLDNSNSWSSLVFDSKYADSSVSIINSSDFAANVWSIYAAYSKCRVLFMLRENNDIHTRVHLNPSSFLKDDVYLLNHESPDSIKSYNRLKTLSFVVNDIFYLWSGVR